MLDAEEIHPPNWRLKNYPNKYDSHGPDGGNVTFADGHAEWIPLKQWNYKYELSEDEGRRQNLIEGSLRRKFITLKGSLKSTVLI